LVKSEVKVAHPNVDIKEARQFNQTKLGSLPSSIF
jgi:hypothetical protein